MDARLSQRSFSRVDERARHESLHQFEFIDSDKHQKLWLVPLL
jgi:hypothetical protein